MFCFTIGHAHNEHLQRESYHKKLSQLYQQAYISKDYPKVLSYLQEMQSLAEANNWTDLQIEVLNDMGYLYSTVLEYDKAMQHFVLSYEIAVACENLNGQILTLSNIGWQYSLERNYEKAQTYTKEAYDISIKVNDSIRIGQMAMNLADNYNTINKLDSAEKYINIALEMLKGRESIIGMPHAVTIKMKNLYLQRKYQQAESLALDYLNEFPEKRIDDVKSQFFLLLSKNYEKQNKISKAIVSAKESLKNNPNITNIVEIYNHLADLYIGNKNWTLAFAYKDSAMQAKDSLINLSEIDRMINTQIRLELSNSEKRLIENRAKQKAERNLFVSILIFMTILTIVLVWIFRMRSVKSKQQKIILENMQKITKLKLQQEHNQKLIMEQQFKEKETLTLLEQEQLNNEKLRLERQLKEQETVALLEQERLNNEIEAKNRQLTAKILTHTTRYGWIKEMLQSLSAIPEKSKSPALEAIIRKLKLELADSTEWNNFLTHFEQMNPLLLSLLKRTHPYLTAGDMQLLACVYLELDTKKITYLLNISVVAYRKKKQRLAGKMGLKVSELYIYLRDIAIATPL
ncbi:MAG: hypothetical protein LBH82_03070 [Bacteroidales bacterium]|nr:hypothetical protein [Bacteroidales bacterium]